MGPALEKISVAIMMEVVWKTTLALAKTSNKHKQTETIALSSDWASYLPDFITDRSSLHTFTTQYLKTYLFSLSF